MIRYVVMHAPGPEWQDGVDFREQPGVMAHVEHFAAWHAEGRLHAGGPFVDEAGGGMMISDVRVTREELEAFAAADPTVVSGLLRYTVRPWYVAMSDSPPASGEKGGG